MRGDGRRIALAVAMFASLVAVNMAVRAAMFAPTLPDAPPSSIDVYGLAPDECSIIFRGALADTAASGRKAWVWAVQDGRRSAGRKSGMSQVRFDFDRWAPSPSRPVPMAVPTDAVKEVPADACRFETNEFHFLARAEK